MSFEELISTGVAHATDYFSELQPLTPGQTTVTFFEIMHDALSTTINAAMNINNPLAVFNAIYDIASKYLTIASNDLSSGGDRAADDGEQNLEEDPEDLNY